MNSYHGDYENRRSRSWSQSQTETYSQVNHPKHLTDSQLVHNQNVTSQLIVEGNPIFSLNHLNDYLSSNTRPSTAVSSDVIVEDEGQDDWLAPTIKQKSKSSHHRVKHTVEKSADAPSTSAVSPHSSAIMGDSTHSEEARDSSHVTAKTPTMDTHHVTHSAVSRVSQPSSDDSGIAISDDYRSNKVISSEHHHTRAATSHQSTPSAADTFSFASPQQIDSLESLGRSISQHLPQHLVDGLRGGLNLNPGILSAGWTSATSTANPASHTSAMPSSASQEAGEVGRFTFFDKLDEEIRLEDDPILRLVQSNNVNPDRLKQRKAVTANAPIPLPSSPPGSFHTSSLNSHSKQESFQVSSGHHENAISQHHNTPSTVSTTFFGSVWQYAEKIYPSQRYDSAGKRKNDVDMHDERRGWTMNLASSFRAESDLTNEVCTYSHHLKPFQIISHPIVSFDMHIA